MADLTFYPRLALQNLRRSRRLYLPCLLAAAGCAAMFYILRCLTGSEMAAAMRHAEYVLYELGLGAIVVGCTVLGILWYADRFVMKQRERELGLYHVLGMEKRQLGQVLAWETLFLCAAATVCGVAAGMLGGGLALAALLALIGGIEGVSFSFSPSAAWDTLCLMAAVFALLLAHDLWRLFRSRPVELLQSAAAGEREPRTRRLRALVGAAALAGGYGISLTRRDPVSALMLFFPAVMLVILGTFCLFSAGLVVLLKALRRRPRFYYRPRCFTAVSGLLYRMGQNARGLANICILSTMVLVTLSCTVCLYAGTEDALLAQYPDAVSLQFYCPPEAAQPGALAGLEQALAQAAEPYGCGPGSGRMRSRLQLCFAAGLVQPGVLTLDSTSGALPVQLYALTGADYAALTGGEVPALAANKVLVCGLPGTPDTLRLDSAVYRVRDSSAPAPAGLPAVFGTDTCACLVVADTAALEQVRALQEAAYGPAASYLSYVVTAEPAGSEAGQTACFAALCEAARAACEARSDGVELLIRSCRAEAAADYRITNGSFLFLGGMLGLVFLLATVLILYYKQLSEGLEDRRRFLILQRVGMSRREVRAAIRTQVLLVFFLPLGMAGLHICMAFPMLKLLLGLFSLHNVPLFAACTAGTFLLFAAVYVLVYLATARQYYRLVRM